MNGEAAVMMLWITRMALCLCWCIPAGLATSPAESPQGIDETEFARRLTELERSAARLEAAHVRSLVRQFAEKMVHERARIRSARVIATYERVDWKTRPYYAVNYITEDYVYLDELDQQFQDDLARNRYWVSVVKSLPDRQLMFELAIDEGTFETLAPEDIVSFSCEIAGVIRGGKSVYSRLIALEKKEDSTE